jgi:hypothetical protein
MKIQWHNDSEAFMLFGKEVNKIIAALQYLSDKNPDVEGMNKFIQRLRNMRSYDEMLEEMIFKTSSKLRKDPPMTKDEALSESMTLDEILYRNDLKLPKKKK